MSYIRTSICSTKFSTKTKLNTLETVLTEYGVIVNFFIAYFWKNGEISKNKLLKPVVDLPTTWLTSRLRKVAAREALGIISATRARWAKTPEKAGMPKHSGKSMRCSSTTAELRFSDNHFDAWLHLNSIGNGIILDIPIKFHKQFNKLAQKGKRLNTYIIKKGSVQFCFEIEPKKKELKGQIGVDTGIKALATLSNGSKLGSDVAAKIDRVKRCKQGSKGQRKARRALKQYIDEVARDLTSRNYETIVIEDLRGITHGTKLKRRLSKNMRRSIGNWNVRYWHNRLGMRCQSNCVQLVNVPAAYTSTTCPVCNHSDRLNRVSQSIFKCQKCGHTDNADVNAAVNILNRFNSPAYGRGCKTKLI